MSYCRYVKLSEITRGLLFRERERIFSIVRDLKVHKIVFDNVLGYPQCYPEVWYEDRIECYSLGEAPEPIGYVIEELLRIVVKIDAPCVIIECS